MMWCFLQVLKALLVPTPSACHTSRCMVNWASLGKTHFTIWRAASDSAWVSSWNSTPALLTSPLWVVVVSPSSSYSRWRRHFDSGRLGGIIPGAYNPQCKASLTTLTIQTTRFPSCPLALPLVSGSYVWSTNIDHEWRKEGWQLSQVRITIQNHYFYAFLCWMKKRLNEYLVSVYLLFLKFGPNLNTEPSENFQSFWRRPSCEHHFRFSVEYYLKGGFASKTLSASLMFYTYLHAALWRSALSASKAMCLEPTRLHERMPPARSKPAVMCQAEEK